jgi:hypothetical protein
LVASTTEAGLRINPVETSGRDDADLIDHVGVARKIDRKAVLKLAVILRKSEELVVPGFTLACLPLTRSR